MSQQSVSGHRIPVIKGYHLAHLIYAGNRTLVYRGTRLSDGQPVVLKLRQGDLPTLTDLLRLRNHYAITQHLNWPGVVQPLSLDPYGHGYVLVMPDEQYGSLSDFAEAQPLTSRPLVGDWSLASETCSYRFLHDRVQQAAYSLIPEAERAAIHLKIGQLLLQQDEEAGNQSDERLFEIVNQLNYGAALLTTQAKRTQLAQLNLRAGAKAKAATAYAAALGYFTAGLKLLTPEIWQQHYELALRLHESAAEAAYLSGNLDQVEPLTQVVLLQARKAADKTLAYQVKILTVSAQAQLLQGVQLGIQALAALGMYLPETVEPQVIDQAFQAVAAQLA